MQARLQNPSAPLNGLQKTGLAALLLLVILFGAWVELRGALLHYRRTDIGPYLRAAWAVREGGDIYKVEDDRQWHYVYPPLFAILMTPLADPPAGASRAGYIPYELSVGLWYALTMGLGFLGVHELASALEETSLSKGVPLERPSPPAPLPEGEGRYSWRDIYSVGGPKFSRGFWALRTLPVLPILPAIGRSQMRGQVGLPVAALICLSAAALVRKKDFRSGLWLSAAISIKVIPGLLLLYAIWRRNVKMLLGAAAGLIIGLVLIPVLVMGPSKTMSEYGSFYKGVLLAGVEGDTGGSRGAELTGITSTDSNSPMAVLHRILHPVRTERPPVAAPWVRATHWAFAFLLTGFYLLWGLRLNKSFRAPQALYFCGFIPLMLIASPVFHPHYVSMALPLAVLMFYAIWRRYGIIPAGWKAFFWFVALSHMLTSIDRGAFFWYLRDFGLVLASTIALWAAVVYLLGPAEGVRRADAL
jgi:hypothetical protein